MRKAYTILLMTSLVLPLACIFVHYHVNLYQIRKELKHRMLEGIGMEELVRLAFHQKDNASQKWEHSREFVFKGQYYDVVNKEECGDSIIYYCWWDNEETILHKQLDGVLANFMQRDPQQHKHQTRILDFFKAFYFEEHHYQQEINNWSFSHDFNYLSRHITIPATVPPVPPPELA